jgi:anti-sigma-K factor RskA
MNQRHEPFDTLAAVYVLGALDGEELREFEAHLAPGCARCAAALAQHAATLAALAPSAPPVVPPPEVKEALLDRIGAPAARPERARRGRLRWAVATAAAVVVSAWFTGAFVAVRYEAQLGQMARESAAQRRELQRDIAALNDELALYRSAAELLRDPATQVVALRGLGPSPAATGRVIWHPKAGGLVFVANLAPLPPGKAYELWTIGDAAPRPAGVFRVDAQGRGSHRIAPVDDGKPVKVFAVTLEPEDGVQAPAGPMVLASK